MSEQLSQNFNLSEFTFSETAIRLGKEIEPTPEQIANARRLCIEVLEPIRTALQRPIIISSGIRPIWLNAEVGGSDTSAHTWGGAADTRVVGMDPPTFARWIRQRGFIVDQVIEEFGRWVHIGIAKAGAKPRMQFLVAKKVGTKTVYETLP